MKHLPKAVPTSPPQCRPHIDTSGLQGSGFFFCFFFKKKAFVCFFSFFSLLFFVLCFQLSRLFLSLTLLFIFFFLVFFFCFRFFSSSFCRFFPFAPPNFSSSLSSTASPPHGFLVMMRQGEKPSSLTVCRLSNQDEPWNHWIRDVDLDLQHLFESSSYRPDTKPSATPIAPPLASFRGWSPPFLRGATRCSGVFRMTHCMKLFRNTNQVLPNTLQSSVHHRIVSSLLLFTVRSERIWFPK